LLKLFMPKKLCSPIIALKSNRLIITLKKYIFIDLELF
jgi:hypothetical protein